MCQLPVHRHLNNYPPPGPEAEFHAGGLAYQGDVRLEPAFLDCMPCSLLQAFFLQGYHREYEVSFQKNV